MAKRNLHSRVEKLEKRSTAVAKPDVRPAGCNCFGVFYHSLRELLAMASVPCPIHGLRDITPYSYLPWRSLAIPEICSGPRLDAALEQAHVMAIGITPEQLNRQFQQQDEESAAELVEYLEELSRQKANGRRLGADLLAEYINSIPERKN